MSISQRQIKLLSKIPQVHGSTRSDYRDIERKLNFYSYSDSELDIIEKGLDEFEKQQREKQLAKQRVRERLKQERKDRKR